MNISYIITACNKKRLLEQVIKERLTRLKSGDELIVVDDGSTDGTKKMIKKYPQIRYFWSKNTGYRLSSMRNKGIKEAKNDCIIQGDDDVLLPNGYVEMLLENYNKNTLISGAFQRQQEYGDLAKDWRNDKKYEKIKDNVYRLRDSGYSGMVCYSKKFALKIGGYDEDFNGNWGGEDSVSGETPIVLLKDGNIEFVPMEDLYNGINDGRKYLNGIKVLTKNGFKNADYIYRHTVDKQMLRIRTKTGIITTTCDHSLFSEGVEKKPIDLKIGDKLDLIDIPIINKKEYIKDAWYQGLFTAEGSVFIKKYRYKRKRIRNGKVEKERWETNNCRNVCLGMTDKKNVEKFANYYGYNISEYSDDKYSNGKFYVARLVSDHKKDICEELRNRYYTKSGEKKVPVDILNANEKTAKEFLQGFLVGDGHIVRRKNRKDSIMFTTKDQSLAIGLEYLLKKINKSYTVSTRKDKKNAFNIKVLNGGIGNNQFIKRNILPTTDSGEIREIYDVSQYYKETPVYDISTQDETFVAGIGGILAHNTNFGHRWNYSSGKCLFVNSLNAIHLYHRPRTNKFQEQEVNHELLEKKLEKLQGTDKIAIIIHTFLRDNMIDRCIHSIKEYCNNYRIYISDAGFMTPGKKEWYDSLEKEGHKVILLPYDSNWTVGRNKLVKLVKEKYVLYVDDDFIFSKDTKIKNLLEMLKKNKDVGIVGGKVRIKERILQYSFKLKGKKGNIKYCLISNEKNNNFYCDIIANFWLAKAEIFKSGAKWDSELNIGGGHSDFFINLKFNTKWKLMYSNDCTIDHLHIRDEKYGKKRLRNTWQQKFYNKWNSGNKIEKSHNNPLISVIIPTRDKKQIITDLSNQTFKDFETIVIEDKDKRGAAWARNLGAMRAKGNYYFFCDDDVSLEPNALETLYNNIGTANWAYGWFDWGKNGIFCKDKFYTPPEKGTHEFIWFFNGMSTMALIHKDSYVGWDEELKRFNDWDMFLRMAERGYTGKYIDSKIFTSYSNDGISSQSDILYWQEKLFNKHLGL